MKLLRYFTLNIFIFVFTLSLISCFLNNLIVSSDYVQFRIADCNFNDGDWEWFAFNEFNKLEFSYRNYLLKDFYKETTIVYSNDENVKPSLPSLDTTSNYTYNVNGNDIYFSDFITTFKGNYGRYIEAENLEKYSLNKLSNGITNELIFTFSLSNNSMSDIDASIVSKEAGKILNFSDPTDIYKFDVITIKKVEEPNDLSKTINMVVMADGYTSSEINYFVDYVRDAFVDAGTFHFVDYTMPGTGHTHIVNDFFDDYFKFINVFAVNTISIESGINTVAGKNSKNTILRVNSGEPLNYYSYGDYNKIRTIINKNFEKIGLGLNQIDTIIIFVNEDIRSYASILFSEFGNRNKQPINITIIGAPARYNVYDRYFHYNVATDMIAHELGHTIARLFDEYEEKGKSYPYSNNMRNIDLIGNKYNPKWYGLYRYNNDYFTSSVPTYNKDQRIGNFTGALYDSSLYIRPTYYSTMNGATPYPHRQFGPVNTYHLVGSFKTRMGEIPAQDPGYVYDPFDNYEWKDYNYSRFYPDWSSSRFY